MVFPNGSFLFQQDNATLQKIFRNDLWNMTGSPVWASWKFSYHLCFLFLPNKKPFFVWHCENDYFKKYLSSFFKKHFFFYFYLAEPYVAVNKAGLLWTGQVCCPGYSVSRYLPPPNGAHMTRLIAFTQSSMSFWELAMSKKVSWLTGVLSFSPAAPGNQIKFNRIYLNEWQHLFICLFFI